MATYLSKLLSIASHIRRESIENYLRDAGFVLEGEIKNHARIFKNDKNELIPVPINPEDRNYPRRILDIIESMSESEEDMDDAIGRIVIPRADIIRYRIEGPDTALGNMRLPEANKSIIGLYDLLKYTAAGVYSSLRDYRGLPPAATNFANTCRFGQTDYGSFIVKIFCPTDPLGVEREDFDEPFGRTSVRAFLDNLSFLTSEEAEDPSNALPPAFNVQFAGSVEKLKPDLQTLSAGVQLSFAKLRKQNSQLPLLPDTETDSEIAKVDLEFGHFIYSRAEAIKNRLVKAEETGREILQGFIVNLHKDRPTARGEQSRQITVDAKWGTSRRLINIRLLPADYRRAVIWHDTDTEIFIDAVIDKRRRTWSVAVLKSFKPLNPDSESKDNKLF
jgi:hypothetical protein